MPVGVTGVGPRVVWATLEKPSFLGHGGQRRQAFLIEELRKSHDVVVAIADPAELALTPLRRIEAGIRRRLPGIPVERPRVRNSAFGKRIEEMIDAASVLVVAHIETAMCMRDLLDHDCHLPIVIDFHNVYSRWEAERGQRRLATNWLALEKWALTRASGSTAVSDEEAAALRREALSAEITTVPNGIDPQEWCYSPSGERAGLAMFGSWHHEPNRHGLRWFLEAVWPEIISVVPDALLYLYGSGPAASDPAVVPVGFVSDLPARLHSHAGIIVPIQSGVGSRVKFIEALASGVPVISTSLGAEGYAIPERSYLRCDTAASFADACVRVLRGQYRNMAMEARQWVVANNSWSASAARLEEAISKALYKHSGMT